jgi:hypothetical protein
MEFLDIDLDFDSDHNDIDSLLGSIERDENSDNDTQPDEDIIDALEATDPYSGMPPPTIDRDFNTFDALLTHLQEHAKQNGYAVLQRGNRKYYNGLEVKYICCDRKGKTDPRGV